jgi:hypothetical protein
MMVEGRWFAPHGGLKLPGWSWMAPCPMGIGGSKRLSFQLPLGTELDANTPVDCGAVTGWFRTT